MADQLGVRVCVGLSEGLGLRLGLPLPLRDAETVRWQLGVGVLLRVLGDSVTVAVGDRDPGETVGV